MSKKPATKITNMMGAKKCFKLIKELTDKWVKQKVKNAQQDMRGNNTGKEL